jgi:hypothetical protein
LIASSPLQGRYDKPIDRESAYEVLMGRKGLAPEAADRQAGAEEPSLTEQAGEFLGTAAGQALKSAMRQAANSWETTGARVDGLVARRQQTPLI